MTERRERIRESPRGAQRWRLLLVWVVVWSAVVWPARARSEPEAAPGTPAQATVRIHLDRRGSHPISPYITGKFCEHLGSNIYNGMLAQVARNPTFAEFPFWTGGQTPDGRAVFHSDGQRIAAESRRLAVRLGWPEEQINNLVESRGDGLAFWWARIGAREAVRVSPDVGPHGGRAQRVEVSNAGEGIAQWMWLPLHRVRRYEYQIVARSPELKSLTISLMAAGADRPAAEGKIDTISRRWQMSQGMLELEAEAPADAIYRLAVVAPEAGQWVVERVLLWPADHVNGADPDVVRLLKGSRLPLLRWPGGNFVSGYHWEDGVGPAERRPTRPNWAWGGVEPNLFGTDEFIAFCRAVGCEPMICINGGDGTPQEAARWIEYCNGPVSSPMGALRAANGHPEPHNVKHWEVGNELWGRWQVHWTTPAGNVDRHRQFIPAMLKADPSIRLYACGAPVLWGSHWNSTLIAEAGSLFSAITDHPLIGGNVAPTVDPLDVYRDFMAVPEILEGRWAKLREEMISAGIARPTLAITELQLFAHVAASAPAGAAGPPEPVRLTRQNLVHPATMAEAIYDTLIYHSAVRLAPFVNMVTHSATVNHGGGLRKERERVYANPCHYAQSAFAAFAGAIPVAVEVSAPTQGTPLVLPDIRNIEAAGEQKVIAALAALAPDGALLISLVHRGTSGADAGPIHVKVRVEDDEREGDVPAQRAEVWSLGADVPWAINSLNSPEAVAPTLSEVAVREGSFSIEMRPYSVARVRLPVAQN